MSRRIVSLVVLVLLSVGAWLLNLYWPSVLAQRAFQTALAVAVSHGLFRVVAEGVALNRVRDAKTRYTLRKALGVSFWIVSAAAVMRVWVADPQAITVAYGLVGAGVAVSQQDLFKNLAGGMVLFFGGPYRIGDRIAVGAYRGDVIDVGMLYTSLLEIGEWVDADQATGRITVLPNGMLLSGTVHNYTKDHAFLWDEIVLPISFDSDWGKGADRIRLLVEELTRDDTELARSEVERLEEKYFLSPRNMEPSVFVSPNENWITFHIRYVAEVRDRRIVKDLLSKAVLELIQDSDDLKLGYNSLVVTKPTPPGVDSSPHTVTP